MLFAAAAIATGAIALAKVFATTGAAFSWSYWRVHITEKTIVDISLGVAGAGLGLVLRRLYAAYEGLQSLLGLNVTMARTEAIARDRAIHDALSLDVGAVHNPPEYAAPPNS